MVTERQPVSRTHSHPLRGIAWSFRCVMSHGYKTWDRKNGRTCSNSSGMWGPKSVQLKMWTVSISGSTTGRRQARRLIIFMSM